MTPPCRLVRFWIGYLIIVVSLLGCSESQDLFKEVQERVGGGDGESDQSPLGITFVYIESGTFTMGSPSTEQGRDTDEVRHEVTISTPFYISTTEITQEQWNTLMDYRTSWWYEGCGSCPVEGVSYAEAKDFVETLNAQSDTRHYRLPTEQEWEYTARAGSTTAYANGNSEADLASMAWYEANANGKPHPVGTKAPNAWEVYDMHGNVREWTSTKYRPYPGSSWEDLDHTDESLVSRGGDYLSGAAGCRSADRVAYYEVTNRGFGVRVVMEAQ